MGRIMLNMGMFETLGLAILGIYLGNFLRAKFPVLKKYCLPGSVVGGTLLACVTLALYETGIFDFKFNFAAINSLFYCIFFAASGAAASMSLLKEGGKLVVIFAILAAVLAFIQNAIALGLGGFLGVDPLISMMTGSIPMTGGHGNAAAFAPIAVQAGASAAMEVAIASATFGLISGAFCGGPFGDYMIKKYHLEDPALDGKDAENVQAGSATISTLMNKNQICSAMYMMSLACGMGQVFFLILKYLNIGFPIHVCCMLGGIIVRLYLDKKGGTADSLYEAIDTVGDFSLGLFVSMSIVSMKLWQLAGLGLQLSALLLAQVVFILIFCYFLTFKLCGKNYDAVVIAVGHIGFGLGAVPVSMATMKAVCTKYRFSKLAFFVVPVIGGFLSNITNAIIISKFLDIAKSMSPIAQQFLAK